MDRPKYLNEIKLRIMSAEPSTIFVASDFADITDKKTISVDLSRLEKEGIIRRILWGVYEKPEFNEFLNEYVVAVPDKVAHAIARNYGWTIVPYGDNALNLLGLSTQVPSTYIYICDGLYKEYSYDNFTIQFKKTTNKEISKLSYKTALIVQALKALGKEKTDVAVINHLRTFLSKKEKEIMMIEAKMVTSWIYENIRQICRGE